MGKKNSNYNSNYMPELVRRSRKDFFCLFSNSLAYCTIEVFLRTQNHKVLNVLYLKISTCFID